VQYEGDSPAQTRPRKRCPSCHKPRDILRKKKELSDQISGGENSLPEEKNQTTKSTKKSHNLSTTSFIDEPNELLLNTAVRELNKPIPDVRWANILLQLLDKSDKLNIKTTSEKEAMEKLRQMPMEALLNLRKGLTRS